MQRSSVSTRRPRSQVATIASGQMKAGELSITFLLAVKVQRLQTWRPEASVRLSFLMQELPVHFKKPSLRQLVEARSARPPMAPQLSWRKRIISSARIINSWSNSGLITAKIVRIWRSHWLGNYLRTKERATRRALLISHEKSLWTWSRVLRPVKLRKME